jgi:hypothetical protein
MFPKEAASIVRNMGLEQAALSMLGQTNTYDRKLAIWVKDIISDLDFQQDYKEWQIDPDQTPYRRRIDNAIYSLACHVVWFRQEERMSEKRLTDALAAFHLKISQAHKTRTTRLYMQQRRFFSRKRR